jgi:hypothetical protein
VRIGELSRDDQLNEQSLLIELPAGWGRAPGWVDQDEEFFVLSGELADDNALLVRYSYVFHSAGQPRSGAYTENGCTLLAFVRSHAQFHQGSGSGSEHTPRRDVPHLNLVRMEWERPKTQNFPAGAARKSLRTDPINGSGLWVIGLLPQWVSGYTEWHSVEEENYILEGEIQTAAGCMTVGSYLAHPPEAIHGPMRSERGALAITRAAGPLLTTYRPVPGYELPLPG